ncbi:flagellar basal body-associated protein FliL [Litorivivens sp.]|uniref:flagellar basal body-associated FliL family protein n=1 Tax=Litorivivens sp. TaxID=2020868 RepID=UPI003561B044
MKNILIIAAAQTVLILASVAGTWFMFLSTMPATGTDSVTEESAVAPKSKKPPLYLSIDPSLVVNLQGSGKMRFLQVQLEVMTRDESVAELLETHNTRIRNDLIFQLGSLTVDDLRQPDGKSTIQTNAKMAINKVLNEEAAKKDAIEAVYFTKFVIQ